MKTISKRAVSKQFFVAVSTLCALLMCVCLFAGCSAKNTSFTINDGVIQQEGTYQVPATLEGGSGRASIESPATITVNGTTMTANIVWSSSNYDLMVVNGVEYAPSSTKGNSTFEIPVLSLEEPLSVQAETTAMGTPHLIDYTISFDVTGVKAA